MTKNQGKEETQDLFTEGALGAARANVMAAAKKDGCDCPTCGQFAKVYRRTITSTMARQLIHAYRCNGVDKWFHTRDVVMDSSGAGDFSKLEMWGLIEKAAHHAGDDGKKSSGLWKVTQAGADFINMSHHVLEYALVYDNRLLELDGGPVNITDALRTKFDYRVLMGWAPERVSA